MWHPQYQPVFVIAPGWCPVHLFKNPQRRQAGSGIPVPSVLGFLGWREVEILPCEGQKGKKFTRQLNLKQ